MPSLEKQKLDVIEDKFERTAFSLTQERSDFLLPQIIDFVTDKKWMNLRPEYQKRLVWDVEKRSAFIESLLLNIPIPTLFLYERELGRYEVMDGQQRINAVIDFYSGAYSLKGLEKWPEINGLKFADLPEVLRRGLDRRRLSATVVVVDTAKPRRVTAELQGEDVRKIVFERLNTGGQHLNAQELRNCLYAGPFNDLLIRLASTKQFRDAWDIKAHQRHGTRPASDEDEFYARLNENQLYSRMLDCEIVLRFFAFSAPKTETLEQSEGLFAPNVDAELCRRSLSGRNSKFWFPKFLTDPSAQPKLSNFPEVITWSPWVQFWLGKSPPRKGLLAPVPNEAAILLNGSFVRRGDWATFEQKPRRSEQLNREGWT